MPPSTRHLKSTKRWWIRCWRRPKLGYFDDPQVLGLFQDIQGAGLEVRGGQDLQVVPGHQFGGGLVQGPVEDRGAPEGGDAVGHIGLVVGRGQGLGPGGAAGVVVLEDHRGGFLLEPLDDIQAVVQVGQVGLARVLAGLDHGRFIDGAGETVIGVQEVTLPQGQVAPHQFVEGGFLAGVLPVAQPHLDDLAFGVGQFPGALAVDELLVAEADGHFRGEMVCHHGAVHGLDIAHTGLLDRVCGFPFSAVRKFKVQSSQLGVYPSGTFQ